MILTKFVVWGVLVTPLPLPPRRIPTTRKNPREVTLPAARFFMRWGYRTLVSGTFSRFVAFSSEQRRLPESWSKIDRFHPRREPRLYRDWWGPPLTSHHQVLEEILLCSGQASHRKLLVPLRASWNRKSWKCKFPITILMILRSEFRAFAQNWESVTF